MWQAAQRRTGQKSGSAQGLLRRLLWLLPMALLALTRTATPASANQVTVFVSGPSSAQVGIPVTFTAITSGGSGCALNYNWFFGDTSLTTPTNTTQHTYSVAGTFSVSVSVLGIGCSDIGSTPQPLTVVVGGGTSGTGCTLGGSQFPITVSATPSSAAVNQQIAFNTSASSFASLYTWTFGDGQVTQAGTSTVHSYASAGTFTVTVTGQVGSSFGCGSTSVFISGTGGTTSTVGGIQVTANGPYSGNVNQPIEFRGFAYSTNASLTITNYSWNFGDGATGSGQDTTHTYTSGGSFSVTLTVTDSGGNSATNTTTATIGGSGSAGGTTVTVSNSATLDGVTVSAGGPYTGSAGNAITFNATTSGSGSASITSYVWSFGDGSSGTGQSTTHAYTGNGNFAVALTVTNSLGHVATATTSANIAGGSRVVNLKQGCNSVALTFPDNTPTGTVLTAVSPQSAVLSIWKLTDPTTGKYAGYFPNSTQASDLTTVLRLDAVSICVNGAATLSEPAV
jgi:PKD repeat protein